jgi:ADP-ribose pyrophosphatase YjhB (NUDIX family)
MLQDSSTSKPIIKAASACVWRSETVLLAQRGKSWGRGFWALPGGRIEAGESAVDAARRELTEETGVAADLQHFVGDFTVEGPELIYTISCWTGPYRSGEAVATSDAMAVKWVGPGELAALTLAPKVREAIGRARTLHGL